MRGADGGPTSRLCALPALFVGLLYDQSALDAAWDLVKDWAADQRQTLRDDVPRLGLQARIAGRSLQDIGRDVVDLARAGLVARRRLDSQGRDETRFLDILDQYIASGEVSAQKMLRQYVSEWNGTIDPIFTDYAY